MSTSDLTIKFSKTETVLIVSSWIRASSPSVVWAAEDGGAGREREGRPSEEKMASPPASSAVCSGCLDAMVAFFEYVESAYGRCGMGIYGT